MQHGGLGLPGAASFDEQRVLGESLDHFLTDRQFFPGDNGLRLASLGLRETLPEAVHHLNQFELGLAADAAKFLETAETETEHVGDGMDWG